MLPEIATLETVRIDPATTTANVEVAAVVDDRASL